MNNYREILKQFLADKQRVNPSFSLRSMARKLEIAPSMLSGVMNGTKNLSFETACLISEKIDLSEKDKELFINLVELERTKSPIIKDKLYQKIKANFPENEYTNISLDKFKIVSEWQHFAILELTLTKNPPKTISDIAKKIGLSELETELSVKRLINIGLLVKNANDEYVKVQTRLQVSSDKKDLGLRLFHKQTLSKAIESLESQSNQEKFVGSETFPLSKTDLTEANNILEEAFSKILKLSSKSSGEDVYHLGIQLFKLTNTNETDRSIQ